MKLQESLELLNDFHNLNIMEKEYTSIKKEILKETGTSTIRVNKSKKRNMLAGASAINICKHQNPGLYKRYKKMKDAYKKLKEQILKKYKSKGMAMARKEMNHH